MMNKLQKIQFSSKITEPQSKVVSKMLSLEENMENKSPEKIMKNAEDIGCLIALSNEEVIGYVSAQSYQYSDTTIYELGSLVVHPHMRGRGIGKTLKGQFAESFLAHKPHLLLTKTDAVKHLSSSSGMLKLEHENLSLEFKKTLEQGGGISGYDIYANELLLALLQD